MDRRATILAVLMLACFALAAATPYSRLVADGATPVANQPQEGGLQAAIDEAAGSDRPTWIVYEVAGVNPNFRRCCSCEDAQVICRLEGEENQSVFHDSDDEGGGSGKVLIALRVAEGTVDRVRFFSGDCELDAGGEREVRLAGVGEAESVTLLSRWIEEEPGEDGKRPRRSTVLSAIAMHAGAAADEAMERFVAPGRPAKLRKQAAFWLGVARGSRGFETLRRLAREDEDPHFRKQVVFAIHVSKEAQAVDELIRLAREDGSDRVRKQALFWLGQRAGKKAVAALEQTVEDDPDTEIQKSALFALSQLPQEEGTPLLMKVARTHSNPRIRKQAFFWLGQSDDPRALEFFEQVLTQ